MNECSPGNAQKWGTKNKFKSYERITNIMELSTSSEATSCAATNKLPKILWNPTVHYCAHKSPSPVPVLSQTNLVHGTPFYLSTIDSNIIHPPALIFIMVSFFLTFPQISYKHSCSAPHVLHAMPILSSLICYSNYILWRVYIIELFIM